MADLSGVSVGRYHIVAKQGESGMAEVYRAYDTHRERDVTIKFIRRDVFGISVMEQVLKRLEREAKALARLQFPNVEHALDFG